MRQCGRTHVFTLRLVICLILALLWEIMADWVGPLYVPTPAVVIKRLWDGLQEGSTIRLLLATLRLAAVGLAVGVGVGVSAVLALSVAPRLLAAVESYVMASAAIPKY